MQEQYENQEEGQIDLLEIIHVMLRKWWLIVLCGIIGAGALGVYTKFFVTPQYSASSTIYILSSTTNVSGSGISLSLSEQLTADFLLLAKSRPVLEEAAEKVGDGVTSEMLAGSVVIENPTGSHMLKVTATNEDAQLAKDIASCAKQVAKVMDTDQPNLMESAVKPVAPVSPNLSKNIMMGGLIGVALAIAAIVLLYMLDDTVKDDDDVRKYLGVNTLAAFPERRKKRRKRVS
mgnify:CR=1 FL=1